MEIYPAVDVQGGRVARAPAADADPLAALERYQRAGARWIHLVDLDRAYARGDNGAVTRAVLAAARIPVQIGGGVATEAGIDELLAWGAARVVVGPGAAADRDLVARLLARHGAERLALGLDARDGRLAPRASGPHRADAPAIAVADLARRLQGQGARTVVYTDVSRDGTLAGPDLAGARALGNGLDVIISGGIASLDDLRAARDAGLSGAIIGRALHEARFTLAEALACVA
ncbi:MAG TPA: HisA/HisF-related TIM barrel protein [Gemmatimonadales bacterium]|nr:HisA/HisF-related TIM barrel protein [Gemmatimonadales bacterium]